MHGSMGISMIHYFTIPYFGSSLILDFFDALPKHINCKSVNA